MDDKGVPIHHPLGFKQHPLEDAGKKLFFFGVSSLVNFPGFTFVFSTKKTCSAAVSSEVETWPFSSRTTAVAQV